MKTIEIVSTQIKNGKHVTYKWVTCTGISFNGDVLKVELAGHKYAPTYPRSEFISYELF